MIDCRLIQKYKHKLSGSDRSKYLQDKTVVVVGPAKTTEGLLQGGYIDSFDVVVRINNFNMFYPFPEDISKDVGSRVDMWYTYKGLEQKVLNKSRRWYEPDNLIKVFKHEIPHLGKVHSMTKAQLTMGMSTIFDLCLRPIKNMYVTGFSFCLNINDHMFYKKHAPTLKEDCRHNFLGELKLFRLLHECPSLSIQPDDYMLSLMASHK